MMQFKIKTLIALTALTTLASCSMMSDGFDDCPQGLSVQFVYDYNVERADMFNDHVGSVTLYVYDLAGNLVRTQTEDNSASAQPLRNPNYRIYSLSQNDNFLFCQCEKCKAIEDQYGGHSGIIVWFVNQVADAVKQEFPDKFVGTFAYQYSRRPPTNIKPRQNVVIRLCSIECCFAHPLDAGCPQNDKFMRDLKGWAELAPHLFIWDYIVDYAQYIAPWPNFQVLGPNIKVFGNNKAIGIFEEAQYQSAGAEFDEMKAWTVNQLLWNPDQDVDSLVNIFVKGYYGKAAPYIKEYYDLCQSLVKPDVHYGIYIRENHEIYSDDFIRKAFDILDKAKAAAQTEWLREQVDRVRMQPLYLHCMRHKAASLPRRTAAGRVLHLVRTGSEERLKIED